MTHGYILAHFPVSVLTAIFPAGLWLAGNIMSPFWILLELRMIEMVVTVGAIGHHGHV